MLISGYPVTKDPIAAEFCGACSRNYWLGKRDMRLNFLDFLLRCHLISSEGGKMSADQAQHGHRRACRRDSLHLALNRRASPGPCLNEICGGMSQLTRPTSASINPSKALDLLEGCRNSHPDPERADHTT